MATQSPSETENSSPQTTPYSSAPPRIATPELHDDPVSDSPPQAATPLSPQSLFLLAPIISHMTPQSLPGTPQLSHRSASGGKLREGLKRMFRPPSAQASIDRNIHPSSATEDTYQPSDGGASLPKTKRHQRLRIRRTLRRIKRRPQYHSDDGYTSDPGPPMPDDSLPPVDMDEDEETDGADSSEGHGGQGAESRSERQRRELQRKLEKNKSRLEQKKDHYQETQASYLQDLGSTTSEKAQQRIKSRFQRDHVRGHMAIESSLKKIDKYEKDMAALLQEGGAKEGLRGKIEGGLKAPFVGIKKGFNMAGNTLKKGRRYIIRTRSSQGGVEDAVELIEEEDEGVEGAAIVLEESDMVTVAKTALEELQKQNETLSIQLEEQHGRLTTVEEVVSEIVSKVGQVKDTYERLQDQVNDMLDLHQNAVGELRGQLSQVESMTVGKTQDLEDILLENQGKVEKLDALVHREIENKAEVEMARNWVMTIVAWTVTFVLHLIAFVLKLSSLMSTRTGALSAVAIAIIAVLIFWTGLSSI